MPSSISTELLQWQADRGMLKRMYKEGMIGYKTMLLLPVRLKVDALMRQGRSRGEAVRVIAKEMGYHKSTIYEYL